MNKLLPVVLCAAALAGCRSPITPETSWADYCYYYAPTGVEAAPTELPALVREVDTKEAAAVVATLQQKGEVLLGTFTISDDTEITYNAVAALAKKLNATTAVWTRENVIAAASALPNPDAGGMDGMDKIQYVSMNADRAEMSLADQLITHRHTIWMLGKKK